MAEFNDELEKFLASQGKTLEDLTKSLGIKPTTKEPPKDSSPAPTTVPESIVRHVVSSSSVNRRRLRIFSGKLPVPNGELDFDTWRRPAQQLVDDTDLSEPEKLSRIVEALLPPASKVVWALGAGATARECVEGLEKAYGTTADAEELYLQVCSCFQYDGETASEFLVRLQDRITKAEDRGAIDKSRTSKFRTSQFLRGCLYNDALLVALDLRGRDLPLSFVQLLHEVRTEEQKQMEKEERRKAAAKPAKRAAHVQAQSVEREDKDSDSNPIAIKMKQLEDLVVTLQQQLQVKDKQDPQSSRAPPTRPPRRRRFPLICYNCGELGHRIDQCTNETNPTRVQKKMAERFAGQGNDGGHQ
ncbi:paraneoplastic antigen Ma1 homolog [Diadema antillarum]|uniref:paraneoplastic antigen Ma1 homolog n=1 Tax=Diadema antillarum TaxID=105358 RepID=UPI003A89C8C4